MERDGHGALHLGPGDLRQVPGVQDEHVAGPLGARGHHDGEEHPCGPPQATSNKQQATRVLVTVGPLCEDSTFTRDLRLHLGH